MAKKRKYIDLLPDRSWLKARRRKDGEGGDWITWVRSAPFASNPRGILCHRVAHVTTIRHHGEDHHHHVTYLCLNGCNFDLGTADVVLVHDPGERLLCLRCEAVAASQKLPDADEIAGRHVHRGALRAFQTCCGASS